jgi:hypothetical protein
MQKQGFSFYNINIFYQFKEPLTSSDMEELIDVMAKRRIALKKLEVK